MRENRQSGSEGGGPQTNAVSLPLLFRSIGEAWQTVGPLALRLYLHRIPGPLGRAR